MRKKKSVPCLGLALFSCLLLSCGGAAASASLFSSAFSEPVSSSVSSNSPSSEVASSSSEEDFDPTNAIGLEKGDGDYHLSDAISNKNSSFSYEIFVRSFYDADGDGVGDFAGVSAKADYLQSLGVGQVWLLPVYPSPTYHGYDIADYYSLNSDYGNLSQFADMLNNLHAHNIKVYLDMVLNHSSIKNPYFVQAKEDFINDNQAADSMKDWYNFYYDKNGNVAYECRFDSSMPDFNFDSAGVQAEFKKILTFWAEKGVDGFRLDAVKYFYYDQTSSNIAALNKLVSYVRNDYPDLGFVGENWSSGSEYLDYYQSDIDSFFCFDGSVSSTGNASLVSATKGLTNANTFTKAIEAMETTIKASNSKAYSSYFLSNHDQDRVSKNLGQKYTAKLGASLTYLLPGTPYCYYGEEEQLKGTRGSEATDVMRRLPMIWSSSDRTGQCAFPDPSWQYLMDSFTQVSNGVEDLAKDPFSLLNHYRKVIQIRNKYPFLFKNGVFKAIPSGDSNIISYRLDLGTDNLTVVHNTRNIALECAVPYASAITDEIDTFDLKPRLQNGMLGLGPYSTVILSNR